MAANLYMKSIIGSADAVWTPLSPASAVMDVTLVASRNNAGRVNLRCMVGGVPTSAVYLAPGATVSLCGVDLAAIEEKTLADRELLIVAQPSAGPRHNAFMCIILGGAIWRNLLDLSAVQGPLVLDATLLAGTDNPGNVQLRHRANGEVVDTVELPPGATVSLRNVDLSSIEVNCPGSHHVSVFGNSN